MNILTTENRIIELADDFSLPIQAWGLKIKFCANASAADMRPIYAELETANLRFTLQGKEGTFKHWFLLAYEQGDMYPRCYCVEFTPPAREDVECYQEEFENWCHEN